MNTLPISQTRAHRWTTRLLLAFSATGAGLLLGARQNTDQPSPTRAMPSAARPAKDSRLADSKSGQFQAFDVYVDSGAKPLGAYEFEFTAPAEISIVGLEGGDAGAFNAAPYYDPAALSQNRLLVAAIARQDDVTNLAFARKSASGMQRVARLHLHTDQLNKMTTDKMVATMIAAGDDQAERIAPLPRIDIRPAGAPVPPPWTGASP